MRLIGRYNSPYVRRVAVTLRLYGIDYVHEPVIPFGDTKADVRKHNPVARVPVLVLDDGETLVESSMILDHLDEQADPDRALIPSAGPERRAVLKVLAVLLGSAEKLVSVLYERRFRPKELWYRPWIEMCEAQVADGFGWLEDQLSDDWFVGGRMTQADVTAAVFWSFGAGARPGFFGRLGCTRLPALTARLEATPAFQATLPDPDSRPVGPAMDG